ncbi:hypothetical protein [Peribacillus sp. YIM B13477]|uniref:hypothetical protein n=1 Tax=Peribacillus sp. YIM B13477 TaxID=3366300 RepID=UPI0036707F03
MKKYQKLFFEHEFQLDENGQYLGEVLVGSRLSGNVLMTAELKEFDSLKELKKGYIDFQRMFLIVYEDAGRKVLKERGMYHGEK